MQDPFRSSSTLHPAEIYCASPRHAGDMSNPCADKKALRVRAPCHQIKQARLAPGGTLDLIAGIRSHPFICIFADKASDPFIGGAF